MNVTFNPAEEIAIQQIAKMMDISPEKVVIQAIRMYQLWKMNKIQLIWPKVINHQVMEVVPDEPKDIVTENPDLTIA